MTARDAQELEMKKTTGAAAVLLIAALPALGAGAAHASGGGGDVTHRGSCSGSTHWKIKAKPDNGRIEVESEIDSNHNGQTWRWVLKHDGSVAARGKATTKGPSGSFEVKRRTSNHAGRDSFRFRATHAGEVCVARVSL
jgi:hypothetical protein